MPRVHPGSVVSLLWVLIFTLSCNGRPTTPKTQQQTKPTLDSDTLEVIPVADGGAYVSDFAGAVWYAREGRGIRVKGLPEKVQVTDVTPTADGGAYLTSGSGLWHLREGIAIKVQEVPTIAGAGSILAPRDKWLWAVLQADRRLRRQVENSATDYRDER
jgi:hypothetical protein